MGPNTDTTTREIRLPVLLCGFMDLVTVDTSSGAAQRGSQRLLVSTAACNKRWMTTPLDIDKAILAGITYEQLATATGESECTIRYTLPPDFTTVS